MPTYEDRLNSEIRWSIKDYRSTTIVLYNEDFEHIIEQHPVMKKNEEAIKETLINPDSVYESKRNEQFHVYRKATSGTTYAQKTPYTSVIIEGADSSWTDARVVTAFNMKREDSNVARKIYP